MDLTYLDAYGKLRDHASSVGSDHSSAQNLAAGALLHRDLGESLGDPFALTAIHVLHLTLREQEKHGHLACVDTCYMSVVHNRRVRRTKRFDRR